MAPFFSIIVPVYNVEKYLQDCIESVLYQSFREWEMLLIDDGSQDRSGEICDDFASMDNRVRVWHLENGGVSKARNFGMRQISGQYFMFMDSDDAIAGGALEKIAERLKGSPDVDTAIFGFHVVAENKDDTLLPGMGVFGKEEFGKQYLGFYVNFFINSPWNKVFKTALLDSTIRFPETMSLGEDLLFCNKMIKKSQYIMTLDEAFYLYKQRGKESLTTKYYDNLFELYYLHYQDVICTLEELNPEWEESQCQRLFELYVKYIKQAINTLWHPDSSLTIFQRYQRINYIVHHDFTEQCFSKIQSNKLYDKLIQKHNSVGIMLYIWAAGIKGKLKEKINVY